MKLAQRAMLRDTIATGMILMRSNIKIFPAILKNN